MNWLIFATVCISSSHTLQTPKFFVFYKPFDEYLKVEQSKMNLPTAPTRIKVKRTEICIFAAPLQMNCRE